jgi:rRNA biogenesis protein RRP5
MAQIYEDNQDFSAATLLFERALKKPHLKKSKKVWIAYQAFKLRRNEMKIAKELLARSLQSLSRHKHIEVISKFALYCMELGGGQTDHGRVLMEDLLSNYPKRSDLWHLYVDKEIKLQNIQQVRPLFERMIVSTSLANNPKNMKTIFKKYLLFEMNSGDEESQERVKEKARDYVKNLA